MSVKRIAKVVVVVVGKVIYVILAVLFFIVFGVLFGDFFTDFWFKNETREDVWGWLKIGIPMMVFVIHLLDLYLNHWMFDLLPMVMVLLCYNLVIDGPRLILTWVLKWENSGNEEKKKNENQPVRYHWVGKYLVPMEPEKDKNEEKPKNEDLHWNGESLLVVDATIDERLEKGMV